MPPCQIRLDGYRLRRTGFTLIEVLVVVAIIGLLVSILLPSLGRAREKTRELKCLSNLAQYGKAVGFYLNDTRDFIPPYYAHAKGAPYWFQYLPFKYLGKVVDITICPSDNLVELEDGGKRGPFPAYPTGAMTVYWSYAMNPHPPKNGRPVLPRNDPVLYYKLIAAEVTAGYDIVRFNPGKITLIKCPPSQFGYVMESASPGLLDPVPYGYPRKYWRTDHGPARDKMNVLMGDGHSESRFIKTILPLENYGADQKVTRPTKDWTGKFKAFWYGAPDVTGPVRY